MAQTARVIPFPSDQFEAAWSALPEVMLKRCEGKERVRQVWVTHSCKVGPDRLLAALRAYLANDKDRARTGGPGLQVWLRTEKYELWLDRPDSAKIAQARFSDETIRQSFVARFTDERAVKWFDRSRLDGDTLVVPWPAKPEWIAGPFAKWATMNGIHGWKLP